MQARGGKPVIGDLAKPASYADAAASADGIIHTALRALRSAAPKVDRRGDRRCSLPRTGAGRGRSSSTRPGIWVLGNATAPADETRPSIPTPLVAWRPAHEQLVLDGATAGIRTVVVRPGIVYGGRAASSATC